MSTHWRKLMNTKFLNGDEIPKGDSIVTIKGYKEDMVFSQRERRKEPQLLLEFEEYEKPMIMTNRKARDISRALGTPYVSEWIGKKITMFPVNERHFGEWFDVINFKKAVEEKKEVLDKSHEKWEGAVKSLKAGETTVESISRYYEIPEELKKELIKIERK